MTPDQRFSLILLLLGAIGTVVWWQLRRYVKQADSRWARVDALILSDAQDKVILPSQGQRLDRVEAAIVTLTENIASLGTLVAVHQSWHEGQEQKPPPRS